MIPPASWLEVHLAPRLVCLARAHKTAAAAIFTQTHTDTLQTDSARPSKHSTPTSERFERGATLPSRVLGSLYGHHHEPLHHADHV